MRQRYDDLERLSLQPRIVYTPKEVVITKSVPTRAASACEKFFEMDRKHTNPALKSLVFAVLYLNNKCSKFKKVSTHCKLP